MFNYYRKELDWGGRKLVLETGKIARQADGAVLVRYGDTHRALHGGRGPFRAPWPGLFPADGELPGEGVRGRQDPRRVL